MRYKIINKNNLKNLIETFIKNNVDVIAPKWDRNNVLLLQKIVSFEEIEFKELITRNSAKEFIFLRYEALLGYTLKKNEVLLEENEEFAKPQIIFGIRPCDAAAFTIIDNVFNDGNYHDEFYLKRREAAAIISISCTFCDNACFCTAVGLSPGGTEGSDILLTPFSNDNYLVEVITEKGEKIINASPELFTESEADKGALIQPAVDKQDKKFDIEKITRWLEENFEHSYWKTASLQCIGCGICTFVCPTCHCFDIQDEGSLKNGIRFRNWDGCQFKSFTLHSSSHNPRPLQYHRYRQRIMHKYNYFKKQFNKILCTGCGRCVRHCPVDLSIICILQGIDAEFASINKDYH